MQHVKNSKRTIGDTVARLGIEEACSALRRGQLIIFPTETFYALGCDAMNADAVGGVFSVKKRSLAMPLPVVIGKAGHLERIVTHVSSLAQKMMDAFWPGPLSLLLPARPEVPELLAGNVRRVAVRLSPHPCVHSLCEATNMILTASSANISGHPSVTRAEGLDHELLQGVCGICADGPEPEGGLPSTVAEVVERGGKSMARILRPGRITASALRQAGVPVLEG